MRVSRFERDDLSDSFAAALVRLVREDGYDSVTVTGLAREAGANRTSFYRRFGSVDDVVSYIYQSVMEDFRQSAGTHDSGWESVDAYIRTMFRTFHSERDALLTLHSGGLTHMLLPVIRPYFTADPDDVDSMYRREYHLGGIMGWFRLWFNRGMEESPDEMADAVLRMMGGTLHPMMDAVRRTRPDS